MTQQLDFALLIATVLAIGFGLAPFVVGFTEVVKLFVKGLCSVVRPGQGGALPAEMTPALACAIGLGLAWIFLYQRPGLPVAVDWRDILLGGPLAGLVASKLFDQGQRMSLPRLE